MTSNDIVLRVIRALEQQQIPYMLSGPYASNAFGVPRSTQDADFIVELHDRQVTPLFHAIGSVLRFDPQMRLEMVTGTERWVGVADSGFKIELFLVSSDPHDRERFARREHQPFLDASAFLPTPRMW